MTDPTITSTGKNTSPDDAADFLCVRCARRQKTCCQVSDIFTTRQDVRRIEEHTGTKQFTEYRAAVNMDYNDQDDDPIWRDNVFRADGTRRVLKKTASGDCTFLGMAGCVLPLEVRPLICRIYPFDYTAEGISPELSDGCPVHLLPTGQGLIAALDMNRQDAVRWHAQLYHELQLPDETAE